LVSYRVTGSLKSLCFLADNANVGLRRALTGRFTSAIVEAIGSVRSRTS
jgi:hypothetical protein